MNCDSGDPRSPRLQTILEKELALEGLCQGDLTATIQLSEILRNILLRMIADRWKMLRDLESREAVSCRLGLASRDAHLRSIVMRSIRCHAAIDPGLDQFERVSCSLIRDTGVSAYRAKRPMVPILLSFDRD
jgi:hypothetical protein